MNELTTLEWMERALETMSARLREEDDTQLMDAYDDLCNAIESYKTNHH